MNIFIIIFVVMSKVCIRSATLWHQLTLIIQTHSTCSVFRVRMGPWKSGTSWNLIIQDSRPGKSWNLSKDPWKWKNHSNVILSLYLLMCTKLNQWYYVFNLISFVGLFSGLLISILRLCICLVFFFLFYPYSSYFTRWFNY